MTVLYRCDWCDGEAVAPKHKPDPCSYYIKDFDAPSGWTKRGDQDLCRDCTATRINVMADLDEKAIAEVKRRKTWSPKP